MAPRPRVSPTTAVVGLLIAFCAVLLAKWLAVAALAALALYGLLRWTFGRRRPAGPPTPAAAPEIVTAPSTAEDCSWCGLTGGHRDALGHRIRPRNVHVPGERTLRA